MSGLYPPSLKCSPCNIPTCETVPYHGVETVRTVHVNPLVVLCSLLLCPVSKSMKHSWKKQLKIIPVALLLTTMKDRKVILIKKVMMCFSTFREFGPQTRPLMWLYLDSGSICLQLFLRSAVHIIIGFYLYLHISGYARIGMYLHFT
jgi:hypothetical protein